MITTTLLCILSSLVTLTLYRYLSPSTAKKDKDPKAWAVTRIEEKDGYKQMWTNRGTFAYSPVTRKWYKMETGIETTLCYPYYDAFEAFKNNKSTPQVLSTIERTFAPDLTLFGHPVKLQGENIEIGCITMSLFDFMSNANTLIRYRKTAEKVEIPVADALIEYYPDTENIYVDGRRYNANQVFKSIEQILEAI